MRLYNLAFIHKFEEIFHRRFDIHYTTEEERKWHVVVDHMGTFHAPMLATDHDLPLYHKRHEGSWLKMMLYVREEMFYIFDDLGPNDYYGQLIVAYESLQFASQQCTQCCSGRCLLLSNTRGPAAEWMYMMCWAWRGLHGLYMMGYHTLASDLFWEPVRCGQGS